MLAALLAALFVREAYRQRWTWTGFVAPASSAPGQSSAVQEPTTKTLWDWLQLLGTLAIPIVVALAAAWFSQQQQLQSDRAAAKQHQSDNALALDQQRETLLNTYIDRMSALLLDPSHPLGRSHPGDAASTVARARTLEVLTRLDGERKRQLLLFLYEAQLITPTGTQDAIISLDSSDLRGVELSGASLRGADLSYADLRGADLYGADLSGANLTKADLRGDDLRAAMGSAELSLADLRGANLRGAFLLRADLSYADLRGAILNRATLMGTTLIGADLSGDDLSREDLSTVNLFEADLRGANLFRTYLPQNLSEANLFRADLSGAFLDGADLRLADLSGANLFSADLRGAKLGYADLRGADLREAKLGGADLRGIDLTNTTNLTQQQIASAVTGTDPTSGRATKLPDYLPPAKQAAH